MKCIWGRIKKERILIAVLCVISIVMALASVLQALATRRFVDYAVAREKEAFLVWIAVFFALVLLQILLSFGYGILYEWTNIGIENSMRGNLFNSILTGDYACMKEYHSGILMNYLTGDIPVVAGNAIWLPPELCSIATKLIAAFFYLGILEWRLAAVMAVCLVFMAVSAWPLRKIMQKYHRVVMEKDGEMRSFFQETLENTLIVRSFQAESMAEKRAMGRMDVYKNARMKRKLLSSGVGMASSLAINLAYMIGLGWCGLGIVKGRITFGTLSAVWQLVGQITNPAMRLTGILPHYFGLKASSDRLSEVEGILPEPHDRKNDWKQIGEDLSEIRCDHLSFSYKDKDGNRVPVLEDLDLTIHKGDFLAITGESGIGKSTLLKLFLAAYYPDKNQITIADLKNNVYAVDAGARELFAYVPQGNFLMSGSIRDAIRFWKSEEPDESRIYEACRIAEASEFIEELEHGYDTMLNERGSGLSEGQLQRLAIARAIYSEKPVLLLDEATSSLDEITEAKVLQNIKKLTDRTVIIVTHRKAALSICNRVVKLNNGRMTENESSGRREFSL